jgi:predicted SAM-dependent methyltransferase
MIETIDYKGKKYPKYQSNGFAARFIFPFAKEVCKGKGYDVGCNRVEWSLPGSIPIDPVIDDRYDCLNFPESGVDYIFSSHMLEHVHDWVRVLDYWVENLNPRGTLFVYLPDYSQEYWRPWNNTKHVSILTVESIRDYLENKGMKNIFSSGVDLYNSFSLFAEKP